MKKIKSKPDLRNANQTFPILTIYNQLKGEIKSHPLKIHFLWHTSEAAQCSQPQPQEDLPFFLSLINLTTRETTTARTISPIIIVERFSFRKASI